MTLRALAHKQHMIYRSNSQFYIQGPCPCASLRTNWLCFCLKMRYEDDALVF